MSDADHTGISEHSSVDFIFRTDYDIHQAQDRAEGNTEGTLIIPLIGAIIDIQYDRCPCLLCQLRGKKRRAATRLFAQTGSGNQQDMTVCERRCQHVIDGQFDVGAVIAVISEREAIWRLDAQDDGTGAVPRLAWNILRFYSFAA